LIVVSHKCLTSCIAHPAHHPTLRLRLVRGHRALALSGLLKRAFQNEAAKIANNAIVATSKAPVSGLTHQLVQTTKCLNIEPHHVVALAVFLAF